MLGYAQPVVNRGIGSARIKPGSSANFRRGDTGKGFHRLGGVALFHDEIAPALELLRIAALPHELLVD